MTRKPSEARSASVEIPVSTGMLHGDFVLPARPRGVVLFAHGSGSSRHSPRNRLVAATLQRAGLATLLMDLLTEQEERSERAGGMLRFDVQLLGERLSGASTWLRQAAELRALRIGYFGASTGAAAALIAAAAEPERVSAVVSRGGRPDLVEPELLRLVTAPCLFIVGGDDREVLALNRQACSHLRHERRIEVIPGASHLFEEPGALEHVAALARDWLLHWLEPPEKSERTRP
ncbi:MAG TPA: dienelactone hydrolase family protein [Polyangiales bacterium]|nr:dienelactone hydrolase family protein [Polyangiales bacterium]